MRACEAKEVKRQTPPVARDHNPARRERVGEEEEITDRIRGARLDGL